MSTGDTSPGRQRLHADFALLHEEGACLPLRSAHGRCRACADACPAGALHVTIDAVELSDACIGCGRCTAACPTQALVLPEMPSLDAPVPAASNPADVVRVECRKVPPQAHRGETVVLPCLGALTPGWLLARAAAGFDVEVVDRGWCQACAAGCSEARPDHPAAAALGAATAWLESVHGERRLVLVEEPLPSTLCPVAIPPAADEAPAMDRRSFFRAAIERPAGRHRAAATPMGGDGRAAYPADARQPSPERERLRISLERLAQAADVEVPAEFYPRLQADARCCDRRMCVALCPTAALTMAEDAGAAQLQWSSDRCIACGTCVRSCPEGALALTPHGGEPGVQVLAKHLRARCASCGDAFTPAGAVAQQAQEVAETLCPTCTKSRRFMDDARRQLFGANR